MTRILISSQTPSRFLGALEKLNIEAILLPENPRLPAPVCSHADMLLYRRADGMLLCEDAYFWENRAFFDLHRLSVLPCAVKLGDRYPKDVAFNALRVGEITFCRSDAAAGELLRAARKVVYVKQGYARCSCLALPDGAVITADRSLLAAFEQEHIPHLAIESGGIELPGYDTGFIGGASGVTADGCVIFFGALSYHRDGAKTAAFLKEHGCEIMELCDCPLYDVGGFIIL